MKQIKEFMTTNEALTLIEQELREVIDWCNADLEHALESSDKSEYRLAALRMQNLKQALNAIKMSYKG